MCNTSDYPTGHTGNTTLKPETGQASILFTMVIVLGLIFNRETQAEFNKTVAWFGKDVTAWRRKTQQGQWQVKVERDRSNGVRFKKEASKGRREGQWKDGKIKKGEGCQRWYSHAP